MNEKEKRKLAELVQGALEAQAAGVVLRMKDWNGFSKDEKAAWLAARKILTQTPSPTARAHGVSPREDLEPAIGAEPELVDDVDPELRSVLERGCDAVELRRGSA